MNPGLRLHLGLFYAFLYVPILVLMALSFNRAGLPTAWGGFSLEWYGKLFSSDPILRAARNTLVVAVSSTVLATIIGTLLAVGVETRRQSAGLDALLFAPMIIPDIVLAIALLSFYTALGFTLGLHSIVLSHVVFNIAFVTAVVRTRMRGFDHSILEASADLGASEFTTFRRVLLPLIAPGIFIALLLVYVPLFTDFAAPTLVGGTTGYMLGNVVSDLVLENGNLNAGAAMSFLMLLAAGLFSLIAYQLSRVKQGAK